MGVLKFAANMVAPVAFLGQGRRLVVLCSGNDSIHEYDLSTGQEARVWPAFPRTWAFARSVLPKHRSAFSPYGQSLLTVAEDGTAVLRDLAAHRESAQKLAIKSLYDLSFSPDGRLVAAASAQGYAKLLDRATFRELATLRGVLMGIHSVAFSPDGSRLAIGSNGSEAVKLWEVESGQELLTLAGQGSIFHGTTFSPDGNLLGSRNLEGALYLWRAPSWAEIEAAEK